MKTALFLSRFATITSLLGLLLPSCTMRETRQEGGPNRSPEFRVRTVEQASLNNLDVLPLREPADMSLPQRNQLIAGYVNKQLPLHIRLQLSVYNPSLESIALAGLDYAVFIDNRPLGTSHLVQALQLPAGDSVRVPLEFEFNAYKFLGDDALPALRNFALGFGDARRQRVTLRVRPVLRAAKGSLGQANRFSEPIKFTRPTASR
ncbi:MAG: LEA type 2 family protein [Janthinobacterium lividum]